MQWLTSAPDVWDDYDDSPVHGRYVRTHPLNWWAGCGLVFTLIWVMLNFRIWG